MTVEVVQIGGSGGGGGGGGDVTGPAGATDNAIVRYDGATGKLIQNSTAILGDDGSLILTTTVSAGFAIGATGNTNPVVRIITNTALQTDGISINGGSIGTGVTFQALSSGSDAPIVLNGKGLGGVGINRIPLSAPLEVQINATGRGFLATDGTATLLLVVGGVNAGFSASGLSSSNGFVFETQGSTTSGSALRFRPDGSDALVLDIDGRASLGKGTSASVYSLSISPTSGALAGQSLLVQDATPSTGITGVLLSAGAAQSTNPILTVQGSNSIQAAGTVKGVLTTLSNATTGLAAGVLAALTNATIVITDGTGQVYRVPCII